MSRTHVSCTRRDACGQRARSAGVFRTPGLGAASWSSGKGRGGGARRGSHAHGQRTRTARARTAYYCSIGRPRTCQKCSLLFRDASVIDRHTSMHCKERAGPLRCCCDNIKETPPPSRFSHTPACSHVMLAGSKAIDCPTVCTELFHIYSTNVNVRANMKREERRERELRAVTRLPTARAQVWWRRNTF